MSILIKDVLHQGKPTNVYLEDNLIADIGPVVEADQTIEGNDLALLPGLVNTHTHAAMTLFRSYADDMELHEWLREKIWPIEAKLTPDDIYWGTRLACLEMIRSGTTCFNDMYFHLDMQAKAVQESGIRAVLSEGFIDVMKPEAGEELLTKSMKLIGGVRNLNCDRIKPALGPHALYTVSKQSLERIKEISDDEDLLVHFHLSETKEEVDNCVKENGSSPVRFLEEIGFLGPRLLAAHSVWLDEKEIGILAKADVKISHNPVSNMKLAVGKAIPYSKMRKAGLNISLGTDGCASNNNLDMFESMKFAALLQKHGSNDSTIMPAGEAFQLATVNGAEALGFDAGVIEVGKLADLMLIDTRLPSFHPSHDLISNVVYSANGSCVDTVICDGEILMQEGVVKYQEEIIVGANKAMERLLQDKEG
ncbi:MAG: amidohydrolase [Methanomassiliicoccales archaeon]|nr:MAG: amidohydrolase [Methanomassiliicoccales archaeon]